MVEVGATGQGKFGKELHKRIGVLQGVNQQCLLPVAKELRGDAQAIFLTVHWPSSVGHAQAEDGGYCVEANRLAAAVL